jgi:hypothetical protein
MKQDSTKAKVLRCLVNDLHEQEKKHIISIPLADSKEIISAVNMETNEIDFLKTFIYLAN